MICEICGKYFDSERAMGSHYREHSMTAEEYKDKFKIGRFCVKCGIRIGKKNKSGCCDKCRDRTGPNNPFFKKTHSQETKDSLSKKCSDASKQIWKNSEYREKIKSTTTGLKRTDKFKKEQSERVKKWYKENPIQLEIRSEQMKNTWKIGHIEPNITSINESKMEKKLLISIKDALNNMDVKKKTIRINGRWFYPDILIDNRYVVEFYGDYWHANPLVYTADDIVHHRKTAKEIWEKDRERIDIMREAGYTIFVVWQKDYLNDVDKCLETIKKGIEIENQSIEKTI